MTLRKRRSNHNSPRIFPETSPYLPRNRHGAAASPRFPSCWEDIGKSKRNYKRPSGVTKNNSNLIHRFGFFCDDTAKHEGKLARRLPEFGKAHSARNNRSVMFRGNYWKLVFVPGNCVPKKQAPVAQTNCTHILAVHKRNRRW